MNKILFDPRPEIGMLQAVLSGKKTQTCRKYNKFHQVGDVLAVAEPFMVLTGGNFDAWKGVKYINGFAVLDTTFVEEPYCYLSVVGANKGNRMYFPPSLARNFIKITGLEVKKPCDFTNESLRRKGLKKS